MAKKNRFRTRVESVHEEVNHGAGWDAGRDQGNQGGWGQSAPDQNGWQNAPATRDSDVQPGDSISNASFTNSNTNDWEAIAPTSLTKDSPMIAATNGWGSAATAAEPPGKSAMNRRNQDVLSPTTAVGMQSMLSTIAEQHQAQRKELTEQLRQQIQQAGDLAYGRRKSGQNRGRHQRESSWSGRGPTSEVGTSHSNRPAGEAQTNLGDTWGSAWDNKQNGSGDNWAGTGEGTSTNTKSKKKRKAVPVADNNVGGWSSADAAGGWGSSVAPGGFDSTGTGLGGWGANAQDTGAGDWGATTADAQAPGLSHSWGAWADTPQDADKQKSQKSGLSGFFARIFRSKSKGKKEKQKQKEIEQDVWVQETKRNEKKKGKDKEKSGIVREEGKKSKTLKKQKFAEPEAVTWATPEDDDDDEYEDETGTGWDGWENADNKAGLFTDSGIGWGQSAPAAKTHDAWSNSGHTRTSRTYAMATDGYVPDRQRSRRDGHSNDHRIVESKGDALVPARSALFSTERLARDRVFWFFDPNNDMRVSSMLEWIQYMQAPLATFGFSKFLESRERGALFTNVEYRSPSAPLEPVFDWLIFDNVQPTMDRILQESLAFYDPASQIVVFAFLLSKSKKSMAIWRRKLPLPENIRHTYGTQITKLVTSLNKQYPIHVDEMPATTPNLNRNTSNKRKWLNWGRT